MKTYAFQKPGGIENLRVSDAPDCGRPSAGDIKVRVKASSLNGHDLNVVKGILPVVEGRVLLTDCAGVVEEIGEGVTGLLAGDTVVSTFFPYWEDGDAVIANFESTPGDGIDGYASEVVIRPAHFFTKAPAGWSFEEVATLPTAGLTAFRALVIEGRVSAGQDVLLLGTGGVSILALQMAKALGARVTITSSSDEKLANAQKLGADHVLNYRTGKDWAHQVLDFTDGKGVDLTLETGGPGTLPHSICATRIGGRIVLVGVLTGTAGQVPTVAIMARQQRLCGITVGSRRQQKEMVRALVEWGLRPHISSVFAFAQLREAMRFQDSGNHFGKIVITF